ncbi:MAG TPA: hybrid sensor histidine kinase/response regulator [Cyanobacteria bacterium UBA8803]|nr:hybrid sensor histidine kinase/response regulator [Cyanobacteria bacterium UBA9273]HBL60791.1 hybrid sensor histidine kinase/response regulator [Cyanobacteria bacterium UBA8803]
MMKEECSPQRVGIPNSSFLFPSMTMMLQESQVRFQPELISQPTLHLLIVDDVMADVELMTLTLETAGINFTYDTADTALTCQQRLHSRSYDAVLSDYRLPDLNGLQVLKLLQQSGQAIPLILVTGALGEEAAVECIKAGMTDYVMKERLFRLPMVLARALQEFEVRRQKEAAIAQVRASAWRETMINRIVQTMRGTLVLEEMLQRTAHQLYQVLKVSHCLISQSSLDSKIGACHCSETKIECQHLLELNRKFSQYYRQQLERGELVAVDLIDSTLAPEIQKPASSCGIRSLTIAPLLYQQSYLGSITLYQCDREREWTADELALVTTVADQCAIALHQARLYQQVQTELTERKRLEEVLRQQAEQLVQANRLKDDFLAIVSHELRTPLSTILAWSQLLLLRKQKWDTDMLAKGMATIERSAKAQAKIIDDILDVSRIIRGNLQLNICGVDLLSVIDGVIEDMRPMAQEKDIQIDCVLDTSIDCMGGDPDRLRQIIWNLLSNAIKFTSLGGRVQISLQRQENYIQIQVSDTGIGISPDFLPYVFDRFRQADSTTTRAYGGLGLGLGIVRYLVELHGGTVYAASEGEGKGATFTVIFPVNRDTEHGLPLALPTPSSSLPTLSSLRVLIVDDDADTCEVLTCILEHYGAQVLAVQSTAEALAAISRSKPDVLISDIGMPDEDGYSLIAKIRAFEAEIGRQTPAVALTAFARDEDKERALQAGFQMHVPKPVEPTELVSVVAHLVGR